MEVDLDEFSIYRQHRVRQQIRSKDLEETSLANELVSLHEINERSVQYFFFDGVICFDGKKEYVERVPFNLLSIGGYEDIGRPSVGSDIWIQSIAGSRLDCWYRLRSPAFEYKRYHKPFLWLADFAKYIIDFLHTHQQISLDDFQQVFYHWLRDTYPSNAYIQCWLKEYGDTDFRRMIANQANYLYCQAMQVNENYGKNPLWTEVLPGNLCAIPIHVEKRCLTEMLIRTNHDEEAEIAVTRKTTVTPYVSECFQHLPWAKLLYCQSPNISSQSISYRHLPKPLLTAGNEIEPEHVQVGDVVAVPSDSESSWRNQGTEYFAYVQSVTSLQKGKRLGLLWLYRPADTVCMMMAYPFEHELFLSNHCNCGDRPIYSIEVKRKPHVAFFGHPETSGFEFFCRQQYIEADATWNTLQEKHFLCPCKIPVQEHRYTRGETVLVKLPSGSCLEPVVIAESDRDLLKVRRLFRKRRDYGYIHADQNELVLTNRYDTVPWKAIERRCQVLFIIQDQQEKRQIPTPYNRQGTADFYYIISQETSESSLHLQPLTRPWPPFLRQGWDPRDTGTQLPPLRGLDIFCGGGNLGRGLEDCGAVDFEWVVDNDTEAIHTYKANSPRKKRKLFLGSVNHYLSEAMAGRGRGLIAQIGEVEVISAGSPCQGFSLINSSKGNLKGLLNESMVASVVSFVDFYCPKYFLLENVKGMAIGGETKNILAQVICALVGMGYQVRTFALDAWNHGSPQSRTRIFISAAAPGLTPLPEPPHTHSHPKDIYAGSLGKIANGLPIAARHVEPTPFAYTTAMEATKDLPSTDARTLCIPFPDHRISRGMPVASRVLISCIPRFPAGSSFITAYMDGYMPQFQVQAFPWENKIRSGKGSRSWSRVQGNRLMPTVMTQPRPDDGVVGNCLHWDEHRLLTIMEVRRAQGFPDYEVLIGTPGAQWKIIGNSVARPVAFALGMSLRKALSTNNNVTSIADEDVSTASETYVSKTKQSKHEIGEFLRTQSDATTKRRSLQEFRAPLGEQGLASSFSEVAIWGMDTDSEQATEDAAIDETANTTPLTPLSLGAYHHEAKVEDYCDVELETFV